MGQAAVSSQGSKISFDQQTNFYTVNVAGLKDALLEGDITVKLPADVASIPESEFLNPSESEKPIVFGEPVEDAFVLTTLIRQGSTVDTEPFAVQMFQAAGCTVESGADTTAGGTPAVGAIDVASDNFDTGMAVVIMDDNDRWVPTLIAAYDGTTITPAMDMVTKCSSGDAINKCHTITPGDAGQIAAAKYQTVQGAFRALDTTNVVVRGTGCAVTSIGDITFEPGVAPQITFNISAGDLAQTVVGSLAANDFQDATPTQIFDDAWFQYATANSSGGITSALSKIIKATFSPGVTATRIVAVGDDNCLNNTEGYMKVIEPCKLVIEEYFTIDKFDEWQTAAGGQGSKYIGIIQPSAAETTPSYSLFLPNAHQTEQPTTEFYGDGIRMTTTWTGNPAGFESKVLATDAENQPWYFCIGDRTA